MNSMFCNEKCTCRNIKIIVTELDPPLSLITPFEAKKFLHYAKLNGMQSTSNPEIN